MPKETFQKFLDARYPGVGDFNEATSTASGARAEMEAAYDEGLLKGYMMAAEEKKQEKYNGSRGRHCVMALTQGVRPVQIANGWILADRCNNGAVLHR